MEKLAHLNGQNYHFRVLNFGP